MRALFASAAVLAASASANVFQGPGVSLSATDEDGGEKVYSSKLSYGFEKGDTWVYTTQQTVVKCDSGDWADRSDAGVGSCIKVSEDPAYACFFYSYAKDDYMSI